MLPKSYFQKGRNRMSVVYTNHYDNDRSGCVSFEDEEQQFVYTDFPPYAAHRVFPCFDQPDLKARMKIAVVTPEGWTALSNQPAVDSEEFRKNSFKAATGCS
jgi:aminopeptidase N